jgi:hypothetical protein
MEDWSGFCWLHGRTPEDNKSTPTEWEKENDRAETDVDGRGSIDAGFRMCNSAA